MDVRTSAPQKPKRAPDMRRRKFAVGGAVIVVAVFGLVGWGMARPGATSFYKTTSEVLSQGTMAAGEQVKVNGTVVAGTVEEDGITTRFAVTDGNTQMDVTTDAALPDAFYTDRADIEVIAQGSYDGQVFDAANVFAKCPSKFKAQQ